ncbi:hypothetical protein LOK49_LG07G02792 [Camellia lanceoleosa]|uniref:Uncharacterized protein n=1 Tax=Camellia lanceoleosa TaxID=1840588 RepID=A0ACC0H3T6_9ERIC|nr:hypothetical protein LOK49_LG07G02792 [Camellia lanceoleosa]
MELFKYICSVPFHFNGANFLGAVFIGCYKPPTSVENSKRLGDRSSECEPAGNQDFSTSSGSVNPKLPKIRDPLDLDLETTNSVLSLCDKPATSGDNLGSLGDQSNAYECTANRTSSTSGSIFLKLQEYGDPLGPDLETINLCELNSRTDLVKTVSGRGYKQKLPCHNVKLNSQEEFEIPLNISDKGFLQWNRVLVGCFFDNDKKFDFHLLKFWAESSWKDDVLDVHSLGENGFFMFKFKPYEIKVEVSWRPWSQRHDVSMAIGEASNSLPSGAEEKGKDVVEDSTFASTSIMFDVLDQLTSRRDLAVTTLR